MTIRDLQRIVLSSEQSTQEDSPAMQEFLKKVRDKSFYLWGNTGKNEHEERRKSTNNQCCFNHILPAGLPKKNGVDQPFWNYQYYVFKGLFDDSFLNLRPSTEEEREKYNKLMVEAELLSPQSKKKSIKQTHQGVLAQRSKELIYPFKCKHIWVKKFVGAGITEEILRIMVWLAVKNDNYKNTHMCIVCGPRIEIAIENCNRIRKMFGDIPLGGSMTSLKINGVTITAYPSNHLDSMRGLDNVSFIFLDEADFFPKHEQENARQISERYISKSSPFICMVSTANRPDGLFASIEKEPQEVCIYKKIFIHYTEGLGKILTAEEVENARRSPSFPREMELMYLGTIGNVFAPAAIDKVQQTYYDPDQIILDCKVSIGLDPSFNRFGICVTRFANSRIEVIEASEYNRPHFNDMINKVFEIKKRHQVNDNNLTIYVDSANPETWQELKRVLNEPYSEQYVFEKLSYYKKNKINPANYMKVIPTPFNSQGAKMLQHTKSLLEDKDNLLLIDKRFDKLLTSLRTCVANEYKISKDETSYHDILDAFRLSLQLYQRSNK